MSKKSLSDLVSEATAKLNADIADASNVDNKQANQGDAQQDLGDPKKLKNAAADKGECADKGMALPANAPADSSKGGEVPDTNQKTPVNMKEDEELEEDEEVLDEKCEDDDDEDDDKKDSDDESDDDDDDEDDLEEEFPFMPIDESVFSVELSNDLGTFISENEIDEETGKALATIFESAVTRRVQAEIQNLNHFAEKYFEEQVTKAVSTLNERADEYLSYVAENWVEENKIALEQGMKVQIAENIFTGIQDILENHNIEIPEGTFDVLESSQEKVEELTTELSESKEQLMKLTQSLTESKKELAFAEFTRGMSEMQVEKLKQLSESVSFKSEESYTTELETLKENFLKSVSSKKTNKTDDNTVICEQVNHGDSTSENEGSFDNDPEIEALAKRAFSRMR